MRLASTAVTVTSASITALLLLLSGCSSGLLGNAGPDYQRPTAETAARWQAPLAHAGDPAQLRDWWQQFNDGALTALLRAAQDNSSSLAQASANIARARAEAITAGVANAPSLEAIASANRAALTFTGPLILRTQTQLGLQSSWEIDLFGALARQREARQASLDASVARWHEARVSLAAEVASAYVSLRHCQLQLQQASADSSSRLQSATLAESAERAGLQSSASLALARASAAEGNNTLLRQSLQCEIALKLLVSLSGMTEEALRTVLNSTASPSTPALPQPAQVTIASVPAEVLRQRPDLAAAERSMAAANASIGATEADRYPRLNLVGNITPTRLIMNSGPAVSVTTWSITSSLLAPLIDGGRRSANVEAARADYRAAESLWRARVRNAVREVEEALMQLQSTQARSEDTRLAAEGYRANFLATETRQRAGLASRIELEEARRLDINARSAVTALTHERVQAWIALYRAVGGGWSAP